ncbi:MAG: hypothetical protein RBT01_05340 [Anaerolineaceae bacterium]|jgi:hypothetical protein|nr:hypothetical protein [Anaerolineaceae bacterium]
MLSRKISIPLIIIVATVVVLVVSINQPFQRAEAIEEQELAVPQQPTQELLQAVHEEQPSIADTVAPTSDPDLPSVRVEEPTDLVRVNEILKEKINASLLQPGWVQVTKEYISFIESEETTTVPENGQVIPRDYILEQWLLVAEDLTITVQYIRGTSLSGEEYTTTLYSKDPRWPTTETTALDTLDLPSVLETRALDDIIAMGFAGETKIEYIDEEGARLMTITTITQFPRPIGFNGWEDARVMEYAQTYFYDWETGLPHRMEELITREDGTQMLAGVSVYAVSHVDELPMDLVSRLDVMGGVR